MVGVVFRSIESQPGVRVADEVGSERTELQFDRSAEWTETETDGFPFPVSDAIETVQTGFELSPFSSTYVRDAGGRALLSVTPGETLELPAQEYCLELCTPVKLYVRLTGSPEVSASTDRLTVEFDEAIPIEIGARSPRSRPGETITVPREPDACLEALSHLGCGMQTTSPSRSYSTTRGYPPLFELGDELSIPPSIRSADSPVTLELPAQFDYLYPATSLAYYLDADLQPAATPCLRIDGEVVHEFHTDRYERGVERLLQQVFFLDCITRTVGHYPIETHAYRQVVDELPFDVGGLYDADVGTRIRAYLSVPFETIEPELPTWSVTAHVEADPAQVPALPHLAHQLAFVRTNPTDRISGLPARKKGLQSFTNHYEAEATRVAKAVFDSEASFVDVTPSRKTDVDVWAGSDVPLEANKLLVEGYENRLRREPVDRSEIGVTIVCNESWMDGEVSVSKDRYDDRRELPFEIDVYEHLTRGELEDVLEADVDFLHYIGHANADGLKCRDGYLDVDSVSSVGADTFFLNACQSYRPGQAMVRNGCIGGIVTLSDVTDTEAATVGRTVARLLNLGFPLRYALLIARRRSIIGGQYLVVGDDSASVVQPESGVPYECTVRTRGDAYELTLRTYPTNRFHLGTLFRPNAGPDGRRYLAAKPIGPFTLAGEELASFLELENAPVEFDGDFQWAFEVASRVGGSD